MTVDTRTVVLTTTRVQNLQVIRETVAHAISDLVEGRSLHDLTPRDVRVYKKLLHVDSIVGLIIGPRDAVPLLRGGDEGVAAVEATGRQEG